MTESEQAALARRWLQYAEDDLRAATEARGILVAWQCCFHAQQAAEKAIKGGLTLAGVAFPRRHDLVSLQALLPGDWPARHEMLPLEWLSRWAVEARYPAELPDATEDDADRAVRAATEVVRCIVRDFETRIAQLEAD